MKWLRVALMAAVALASTAMADVPQMINYQGRLTNSSGDPLDTTVSMRFTIYDNEIAGLSLWSETHPSVTVDNGTFSVILGEFVALADVVFNQPDRWLGITVGTDPELAPRTRLVSVAYAHRVSTVDGSSGGVISGDVDIQSDLDVDGAIYAWDIDLGSPDAVSALEIMDEPGLARDILTTVVPLVSGDMQDIVTVDLTIPASGYIHLTGRCYVRFDNTRSYRSAYIQLDEEAGGSSESGAYVWIYLDSTVSGDYYRYPAYVDRVYQKAAGTYTFRLEGTSTSAAGALVDVYGSTITAVYYPTSYGSVTKLVQDPGDHPEAVSVTVAGDDESDRTAYKIDLRYYELRAKEARLRAIQAESDLLEAQTKRQAARQE